MKAAIGAHALLVAGGIAGYAMSRTRVNIRRMHNALAAAMALVVGLGILKHTKKLLVNENDPLAWGHFGVFAAMAMLTVWILMAHNRRKKKRHHDHA